MDATLQLTEHWKTKYTSSLISRGDPFLDLPFIRVNQKMGFFTYLALCLLGILFSNPFLGAEADSCARDWLQSQGSCYAYFDNKLSWQEAEIECQSYGHGTHLASVQSKAEALLMIEYISTCQQEPSDVWIGLHEIRQGVRWIWSDESTYNFKMGMKYQPDNYRKSVHCGQLQYSTGFKEWNKTLCTKRNAYVCKYEL